MAALQNFGRKLNGNLLPLGSCLAEENTSISSLASQSFFTIYLLGLNRVIEFAPIASKADNESDRRCLIETVPRIVLPISNYYEYFSK